MKKLLYLIIIISCLGNATAQEKESEKSRRPIPEGEVATIELTDKTAPLQLHLGSML
jgi:hypothetical protein